MAIEGSDEDDALMGKYLEMDLGFGEVGLSWEWRGKGEDWKTEEAAIEEM